MDSILKKISDRIYRIIWIEAISPGYFPLPKYGQLNPKSQNSNFK
jgi:hypothetical protein